jgi:hypothetical protein
LPSSFSSAIALALHGVLLEDVEDLALLIPDERGLGEDVGTVVLQDALEGLGDELFGVAQPVGGGGVDPVDAEFDSPPNGPHGLIVILRPPGCPPSAPADSPATEADRRDL